MLLRISSLSAKVIKWPFRGPLWLSYNIKYSSNCWVILIYLYSQAEWLQKTQRTPESPNVTDKKSEFFLHYQLNTEATSRTGWMDLHNMFYFGGPLSCILLNKTVITTMKTALSLMLLSWVSVVKQTLDIITITILTSISMWLIAYTSVATGSRQKDWTQWVNLQGVSWGMGCCLCC